MWFFILGIIIPIIIILLLYFGCELDFSNKKTRRRFILFSIIILTLGIGLGTMASVVAIVPAGHIGIHDLFGAVNPQEYPSGLQFKHPFAHMEMMSIKTHEIQETSEVPSKEGLIVRLDTSILFRIEPNRADEIYKKLGIWYWDVIIIPQLRSIVREVTSQFEAKALYTTGRLNITEDIFTVLYPKLKERGIILERVLLRDLGLPLKLTEAIEQKLTAEQQIEQKQFEVEKERQEADRKRVEAQGIADANDIIAGSLTENYLRWYWIDNLDTHNSVIYVPVGEGGMPIFKEVGNWESE